MKINRNDNIDNLTRKEWLDVIDRLILREQQKNSRTGITTWVLIGALGFFLSQVINYYFKSYHLFQTNYDLIDLVKSFFSLSSLILILICLAIMILKLLSNPKNKCFTNFVKIKNNLITSILVITFLYATNIIPISLLIISFIVISFTYIYTLNINLDTICIEKGINGFFKSAYLFAYYLSIKYKIILFILTTTFITFLIVYKCHNINFINKDTFLFLLYCFLSTLGFFALLHNIIVNSDFTHLKEIENYLITTDKLNKDDTLLKLRYYYLGYEYGSWKQQIEYNMDIIADNTKKHTEKTIEIQKAVENLLKKHDNLDSKLCVKEIITYLHSNIDILNDNLINSKKLRALIIYLKIYDELTGLNHYKKDIKKLKISIKQNIKSGKIATKSAKSKLKIFYNLIK